MHDVVLGGGTVLDGTGTPAVTADVSVTDGRIAAIGSIGRSAARRFVDVTGAVVCPGFIDGPGDTPDGPLRRFLGQDLVPADSVLHTPLRGEFVREDSAATGVAAGRVVRTGA